MTATSVPASRTRSPASLSLGPARRLLALSLAFAGLVHASLAPEHLAESALVGGLMLAGGFAQIALAIIVTWGPRSRIVTAVVVALSAMLIVAWLAAVTVGLPAEAHGHAGAALAAGHGAAGHGAAGHVEPVTALGVATAAAEGVTLALALLLGRHAVTPHVPLQGSNAPLRRFPPAL